jgi:hypothetical protein
MRKLTPAHPEERSGKFIIEIGVNFFAVEFKRVCCDAAARRIHATPSGRIEYPTVGGAGDRAAIEMAIN